MNDEVKKEFFDIYRTEYNNLNKLKSEMQYACEGPYTSFLLSHQKRAKCHELQTRYDKAKIEFKSGIYNSLIEYQDIRAQELKGTHINIELGSHDTKKRMDDTKK